MADFSYQISLNYYVIFVIFFKIQFLNEFIYGNILKPFAGYFMGVIMAELFL